MPLENATKRGDTIVETMLAFAVFGLVAIMTLQVMQRGVRTAQTALEINLVRNQMNAQAEALRFLNASYIGEVARNEQLSHNSQIWKSIVDKHTKNQAAAFSRLTTETGQCRPVSELNGQAFALGVRQANVNKISGANLVSAKTYARLVYQNDGSDTNEVSEQVGALKSAEGIWIEAVRPVAGKSNYYDFHIRSCWTAPSGTLPVTLDTLVRLYVP